jgi:primosomal protein N' (replication factor Y) (superfamily II helicase)
MDPMYSDIAIPSTTNKVFTYNVPTELREILKPGMRVIVPFGRRQAVGFVVALKKSTTVENLKSIKELVDLTPNIHEPLFKVAEWMSQYYTSPMGDILKTMYVSDTPTIGGKKISLVTNNIPKSLSAKEKVLIAELSKVKSMTLRQLKRKLGQKNIYGILNKFAEIGIVEVKDTFAAPRVKEKKEKIIVFNEELTDRLQMWEKELAARTSTRFTRQLSLIRYLQKCSAECKSITLTDLLKYSNSSLSTLNSLIKKNLLKIENRTVIKPQVYDLYESALGTTSITLNNYQERSLQMIEAKLKGGAFHAFLLHGVTGSGKTQVYIEAIRKVLALGKTAIVLVPEISLTPQIVRRFRYHLGENVNVFHSRMTLRERYDAWYQVREGKSPVIIGPRSAVFAPLKNVGLIVVDEEHETSYKQYDQSPRYHARDVAIMRAVNENACVILGSATPSLESYHNAQSGKYTLLELPERIDTAQLPAVKIIDMAVERNRIFDQYRQKRKELYKKDPELARLKPPPFEFSSISDALSEKIEDRLRKHEGIILLQNRRGFSSFLQCPQCGYLEVCSNCSISLTYHSTKDRLQCHYCGDIKQAPIFCPKCQSTSFKYIGIGTQRVESEIKKLFPIARILRMDLDTTAGRGAHDIILRKFAQGEADILLGTQMVAKGLDFPRVTLVGVISADTQMLLPDFRSGERTFQLLTQVSGRAGRSTLAGEVIIQTLQPNHPSLQYVLSHDYKGFYQEEIATRQELSYPPFSRLTLIEFKGKRENEVALHAQEFGKLLRKRKTSIIILGPAPAAIAKIKGYFRQHLIIKSVKSADPSGKLVRTLLNEAVAAYCDSSFSKSKNVRMTIDVDPASMM